MFPSPLFRFVLTLHLEKKPKNKQKKVSRKLHHAPTGEFSFQGQQSRKHTFFFRSFSLKMNKNILQLIHPEFNPGIAEPARLCMGVM